MRAASSLLSLALILAGACESSTTPLTGLSGFGRNGTATHVSFSAQPSTTLAGATISPAVEVVALDSSGNADTTFASTVTVAIGSNPGGGTLSGTTSVVARGGVASFGNLSIDKAGSGYTLQASAVGLASATSASFDVTPATPIGAPPAPSRGTAGAQRLLF